MGRDVLQRAARTHNHIVRMSPVETAIHAKTVKTLQTENYGLAREIVKAKARPVDRALFDYTFENGTDTSTLYSTTGLVDENFLTTEDGSWSQVSFQFTANDTTTRFGIYSNPIEPISIDVDDVSVTLVPEPATMVLFGVGLLGAAGFRRKNME